jgi:hypothetical protein
MKLRSFSCRVSFDTSLDHKRLRNDSILPVRAHTRHPQVDNPPGAEFSDAPEIRGVSVPFSF